jgi:hypothetical protein
MNHRIHRVSSPPNINHDLQREKLHFFILTFPSGTVELPNSTGFDRILAFKKASGDAGTITIQAAPGQTINGESSVALATNHESVTLVPEDETGFHLISLLNLVGVKA